ncbi:MAG: bifunctional oligoribonuclease/PAP phosphatase NrnA, partial [Chloroflexota bacterium]
NILLVTHIAPDGDAIGSITAMAQMLEELGVENLLLACDDPAKVKHDFIPMFDRITADIDRITAFQPDLVIILDCSDERRGGKVFQAALSGSPIVVNIDHHITNLKFANHNLVRIDAASTTQIIYDLLLDWRIDLSQDIATSLLTGLVTDTLCFRTSNVTPRVMQVASELMSAGVSLSFITERTVNRRPVEAVQYWATQLGTLQLEDRIVWTYATKDMRRRSRFKSTGDASLVTLLNTVWEADMAASFVETGDNQVEVSLRAKRGYDVSGVAYDLGGGGHPAAAGCTIAGPLDSAIQLVLGKLRDAWSDQTG